MPKHYPRYAVSTTPTKFQVPPLELQVTHRRSYDVIYKPKYYDESYRPRDRKNRTPTPPQYKRSAPNYLYRHRHYRPPPSPPPPPLSEPYRAPHYGLTRRSPDVIYMPRHHDDFITDPPPKAKDGARQLLLLSARSRRVCHCCHRHNHNHHHDHRTQRHKKYYYRERKWRHSDDDDDDNDDDDDDSCCSCCDDAARVRLFTHDYADPFSCTCFPNKSSKTIPAMMYDGVRCPHHDRCFPQAKQDVFAYPWTVQTNRPRKGPEYGYRQGQVPPPSAVTAPPLTLYNKKESRPQVQNPPPHTAPVQANMAPLLTANPSDRRLRRVDRKRLAPLPEDEDDVTPFDSISQVAPPHPAYRPPSLRLRTAKRDSVVSGGSKGGGGGSVLGLGTPRTHPIPLLDRDGFPQTPTRIFKGEYIDPKSGEKYEYNIQHGKQTLGGTRHVKTS